LRTASPWRALTVRRAFRLGGSSPQVPGELAYNAGRVHDRPRVPAQRDRRRGGLASPSHAMAIASRSYAALAVYWSPSWPQAPFALGDFPVGKVELVMQSIANHSDKRAVTHSGKCRPFCFVE